MRIREQDRFLGRGVAGAPQQMIVKAPVVQDLFGAGQARHFFRRGADHDSRVVKGAVFDRE